MKGISTFLFVAILFSSLGVNAAEVKLMYEDSDSFPFGMKNKTGIDFILLNMVAKKLGVTFNYIAVPWERCLQGMQAGDADGCFSASFKEKRMENGDYPMSNGKPDESKQLHVASYSLFVPTATASKITVSGFQITGLEKGKDQIGVTKGYSISEDIKKEGFLVEDSANKSELNFKKLAIGRLSAIATLTQEGDYYLNQPEFKGKIVKIDPPMVQKAYFLMFGKAFVQKNSELANKIWSTISEVRESAEYKKEVDAFISK